MVVVAETVRMAVMVVSVTAVIWMIVAGVIVLLFGGTKLPQLAKGLGEGIREFKKSMEGQPEETTPGTAAKTETGETTSVTK